MSSYVKLWEWHHKEFLRNVTEGMKTALFGSDDIGVRFCSAVRQNWSRYGNNLVEEIESNQKKFLGFARNGQQ